MLTEARIDELLDQYERLGEREFDEWLEQQDDADELAEELEGLLLSANLQEPKRLVAEFRGGRVVLSSP